MQANVINNKMNCFQKIKSSKIINRIASYLDEKSSSILIQYIKNKRPNKKLLKESLKQYIIDFGINNEKVKHFNDNNNTLKIYTNIFNIQKDYLLKYSSVLYKNERIELNKKELYQYLHLSPQNDIFLSDTDGSKLKISKYIIGYTFFDKSMRYQQKRMDNLYEEEEEKNSELEDNYNDNSNDKDYFPLKFISNVNYWCIILCSGGYFAYGLYLKDKEIEHKSDHKYVVRKKAGKRQVVKDKSKNISSMGAQLRRANEKKHKENIELVLKVNQEYLDKCDCIFIQAPGVNKSIFLGEGRPLNNYKNKLFNLPFNLPKANYTNICLAYKMLTSCSLEIKDHKIE
jgi:hypothetical protein